MALGANYATIDQLKVRLGINDTFDDTILSGALDTASRAVEKICNRQFNDAGAVSARLYYPEDVVHVETDDFSTTTGLILKTDNAGTGAFDTTWAASDYQVEPLDGIIDGQISAPFNRITAVAGRLFIFPRIFWTVRRAPIQVTARWGFAAVPAAVTQATLIMAEELAKLKDAPFGVAGFGEFGSIRVRENPKVKMLLKPYRADGGVLVG